MRMESQVMFGSQKNISGGTKHQFGILWRPKTWLAPDVCVKPFSISNDLPFLGVDNNRI